MVKGKFSRRESMNRWRKYEAEKAVLSQKCHNHAEYEAELKALAKRLKV